MKKYKYTGTQPQVLKLLKADKDKDNKPLFEGVLHPNKTYELPDHTLVAGMVALKTLVKVEVDDEVDAGTEQKKLEPPKKPDAKTSKGDAK